MNVFITGASGYIGRHVALELVSRGHQVTGLARQESERTNFSREVEWCYANLSNFEGYWQTLEQSDAVIHCAMDYSSGQANSELDKEFVDRISTFSGIVIYTGNLFSTRSHGLLEEAPQPKSEHWRYQNEVAALNSSKDASVVRLGFVYGSSGGHFWDILSPGTVALFETQEVPDVVWPMVHVKDVARLYASILESKNRGVFHAFDGKRVRAREIIESARSVYEAHGISSSESQDYVQQLLQSSVITSNERSISTGWRPAYSGFTENAELAYLENSNRSL
ncbi:NAD-dependent epimerase/dehydratase family protein [bacterium]|nr:NAD-dependent epimerase/dehydratase family protein [bacterium]